MAALHLASKPGGAPPLPLNNRGDRGKRPPPLPPRRATQPSTENRTNRPPSLPPRKASNESVSSAASGRTQVSAISRASFNGPAETNVGTAPKYRIKAPDHNSAVPPSLPERRPQKQVDEPKARGLKAIQSPPPLPKRHQSMPVTGSKAEVSPIPDRSEWRSNLNNVANPPPLPPKRPQQASIKSSPPIISPPTRPAGVVELDENSFDDVVLYSGKPAFVDFYAPFCKCTQVNSKHQSPLTILQTV